MNAYEAKQEARRQRLIDLADRMQEASDAAYQQARRMADVIPMGQPILVGHHSEKRDRAYRARIWRTQDRCLELQRKAKYFREKAASVGSGGISSDDESAGDKLTEKLSKLEKLQDAMRKANKIIRKHKAQDSAIPELAEIGISESTARKLLEPDFCGRIGFADYQLTNNNANIRRIKQRIAELGERSTETIEREIGTVTVREDSDDNRLWLVFPGKPADNVRAMLKQNGFRWSPDRCAWVRKLNNGARSAADYVLRQIKEQQAA